MYNFITHPLKEVNIYFVVSSLVRSVVSNWSDQLMNSQFIKTGNSHSCGHIPFISYIDNSVQQLTVEKFTHCYNRYHTMKIQY